MTRFPWAKMPTDWILDGELSDLRWGTLGSNATAALALYVALVIKANRDGLENVAGRKPKLADQIETTAPYELLQDYTLFSRGTISAGLSVLRDHGLLYSIGTNRSRRYRIGGNRERNRWAQLPQWPWSRGNKALEPLQTFTLRSKTELTALKLYLLFVAFRNRRTQLTNLSYTAISEYSGIDRGDIRTGISLLIHHQLVQVLHADPYGLETMAYHSYKLAGFSFGPTRPASMNSELA